MRGAADGPRILIVEDDPTLAENLYGYLERQGMAPDAAYDGHGALALLRGSAFDAVVLDLGLPGLGGLDVLRAMRRESALWRPVLVLTARERLEDKLLAFELGAEDYLVKPFSLAEVAARLRVLIRRGRGRRVRSDGIRGSALRPGFAGRNGGRAPPLPSRISNRTFQNLRQGVSGTIRAGIAQP